MDCFVASDTEGASFVSGWATGLQDQLESDMINHFTFLLQVHPSHIPPLEGPNHPSHLQQIVCWHRSPLTAPQGPLSCLTQEENGMLIALLAPRLLVLSNPSEMEKLRRLEGIC
jgi:hypothetical protein